MPQAAKIVANDHAAPRGRRARRDTVQDAQKRAFLRMASHELRTPLNSILGFSEILAAELYGPLGAPQYKEYADIIQASGQRLLSLCNQVIEIARLEGHATDFDPRPEGLDQALDDVLLSLRDELAANRTEVVVANHEPLPTVLADPRGLRTVLNNLMQNAITFSEDGSHVRVSAIRAGDWVEVSLHNEGPGIEPDDLARIIKPFEQGENPLTRKAEGAGLGLPICALTCEAMGGRLRLQSAPGQGFTARVRLPAG